MNFEGAGFKLIQVGIGAELDASKAGKEVALP